MRVRRAQARLVRAGRPRSQASQTYPCKPMKGEGDPLAVTIPDFG